jgi:tRNA 5-methylaminomethyl-2-thiouridine biosynthesis bifunctional protein
VLVVYKLVYTETIQISKRFQVKIRILNEDKINASQMQFSSIKWINNKPYSIDFNDIYFNSEDGLQETEYVFIEHNQLKQRFAALENSSFTIIETGFGTGLNFLAVAAHWLTFAPPSAVLHYISIEKYPLKLEDLSRAHETWPQFADISYEFLQQYTYLKTGDNQISMAGRRIDISLQVDDILTALPQIQSKADAWMLDGFAPAKNADMWSDEVFAHVKRLSKNGTTFATFTSAGAVRRGLTDAGFKVKKHAGFGKKREMLSGTFI